MITIQILYMIIFIGLFINYIEIKSHRYVILYYSEFYSNSVFSDIKLLNGNAFKEKIELIFCLRIVFNYFSSENPGFNKRL